MENNNNLPHSEETRINEFISEIDRARKRRKKIKIALICAAVLLIAALGAVWAYSIAHSGENIKTPAKSEPQAAEASSAAPPQEPEEEESGPVSGLSFTEKEIPTGQYKTGPLILVNYIYGYDFSYAPALESVFAHKDSHYNLSSYHAELESETLAALCGMAESLHRETGSERLLVMSCYRSLEAQEALYAESGGEGDSENPDSAIYAKPGYSEHHTGLCFDFSFFNPDGSTTSPAEAKEETEWLLEHCVEYGFLLRYPEEKRGITKVSDDPWHFRYVGAPHAEYMQENELVPEEYLLLLLDYAYGERHLRFESADGNSYEIYYVEKSETELTRIPVPDDCAYTVSGTNMDGFIVTVTL